jgi:hypothetical protein
MPVINHLRRYAWAGTVCVSLTATLVATEAAQKPDKDAKDGEAKRPQMRLKAQPVISTTPARIVLTAELVGGSDDFEEYYCPTVEWDWGDGTHSEATSDCAPYEAGKSEIKRRFTVEHIFRRAANYRVAFRLKRHDKAVGMASTQIQVRPGLSEGR